MKLLKVAVCAAALSMATSAVALAKDYTLKIQTHLSAESPNGKNAAQFAKDVESMSSGRLKLEMYYSGSIVKGTETFDAVANGILDGDMTTAGYQTGKNPAFQFLGDIMGGYNTPWEQLSWLYYGGGMEKAQKLYNKYGLQLIGWWVSGQETMSSSVPLASPADLKDWKFRSPPGMETEIFAELGAKPIVMGFGEVFTALETKVIEGADAANLAVNKSLGLYDVVKHATYPGFHSMPSDHLAINKDVYDALPNDLKSILNVAMQKLAFQHAMGTQVAVSETASTIGSEGVTLHNWSAEDRATFRAAAQKKWQEWGDKSPEARELVDSHVAFMKRIGLIK
ncbi:TRAP transporter substrate-binding protein [Terasakiella sp. SH-1]|uniref:TRAP transporter substrate-binding protein n=1 Tax=Terasakiella sp. SH-1 TaxID=2560057 RepID=UPI001073F0AE|nr:TRAP transporter substrate-binding protein [Terasakiella sp. SH-1]